MRSNQAGITRDTIGGMLWMAWGKGGQAALQLLLLVVLARLLAPADFGVVSAALVVIGFAAIFSQLGVGPAVIQRADLEERHLRTAFAVSVLFGCALGVLVWLAAPAAARFVRVDGVERVLRALAWLFPIRAFAVVAESIVRRELRFRWLANLEVASFAIGYGVVGIALALAGWGVWALVGAQLAQAALRSTILLASVRPPRRPIPERRAFAELMYFGGGFTIAKVANYAALQGDNLVVGRWLGAAALGLYGRAYQLMAMPASLLGEVLDEVLFPTMALVQKERDRLAAAYVRGVALVALVTIPASAVLLIVAPEVVHVLLGPKWADVVTPFQILAVGLLFRTSYKMSESLARATGAVYRRAWRQGVYASLVVGGSIIGQRFGISGVSLGVLAALVVNFLLMAQLSLALTGLGWSPFWRAHRAATLLGVMTGAAAWAAAAVLRSAGTSPVVTLIGAGAAVTLLAAGLIVFAPRVFLGADGTWMFGFLRGYLPSRRGVRAPSGPSRGGDALIAESRSGA